MPRILGIDKAENKKNQIVNGGMDFWQRGDSIIGAANVDFLADRWRVILSYTGGATDYIKSLDVPNNTSAFSLHVGHTTANTSSFGYLGVQYLMERQDARKIFDNKTVTLSFWYKSNVVGKHYIVLNNSFGAGVVGATAHTEEFDVNVTDTWEKKNITIDMSITTFGTDAENTFSSLIEIGIGTSGLGQTSLSINDYFRLSQVMLNEGAVAAPFQTAGANAQDELAMCQRYYEKGQLNVSQHSSSATGNAVGHVDYKVTKRAIPSLILVNLAATAVVTTPSVWINDRDALTLFHAINFAGQHQYQDSWESSSEF